MEINKRFAILALLVVIVIVFGVGLLVFRDYQKTSRLAQEKIDEGKRITLLPQQANKEVYPKGILPEAVGLVDAKRQAYIEEFASIDARHAGFVSNFVVNYTLRGIIQNISTEEREGIGQVHVLTLRNATGETITLDFTQAEVGDSQVFKDSPGNIEEVAFSSLKINDDVEIRGNLNLTDESPNHYLIKIFN